MDRGWIDITEYSGADRPAEGGTRIIRQAGALYRMESDGTISPLISGGVSNVVIAKLRALSGLTDENHTQAFFHSFTDLSGWVPQSIAADGSSATMPIAVTTEADVAFIRNAAGAP